MKLFSTLPNLKRRIKSAVALAQLPKSIFADSLYKNTLFLLIQSLLGSSTGFVFWTLTTKIYEPSEIGIGSALISAMLLLGFVSSLGLGIGIIRFLSIVDDRNKLLNSAFTISIISSFVLAGIFIIGLPIWSPKFMFLRDNLVFTLVFIVFVVVNCFSNVLIQTFIGLRQSRFTIFHNLTFASRLVFLVVFSRVGNGYGILMAWGIGEAIAMLIDLNIFLPKILPGYRFFPYIDKVTITRIINFTSANYLAELLKWLPGWILPIMVLNILGAESNAYFYISLTISSVVLAIPMLTSLSLFAEGSQTQTSASSYLKGSLLISLSLLIPAVAVICLLAGRLLSIMGKEYSEIGQKLVWLLAPATIPICVTQLYVSVARVEKKIAKIIALMGASSASVLGLSWILMPSLNILGIGVAWLVGHTCVMLAILPSFIRKLRQG